MSDLSRRIESGAILATLLLVYLWAGSFWFDLLLIVGALIVYYEFARLILRGWSHPAARGLWLVFGLAYITLAVWGLRVARSQEDGFFAALLIFLVVWAVDVGAFAAGRTLGGPKIAPRISPSKTWAGLLGGIIGATAVVFTLVTIKIDYGPIRWGLLYNLFGLLACAALAVVAQAGDFFESWLKRRAGVKDSGTLIPGHGGLFDRIDGLLPVAAAFPLLNAFAFSG